MLTEQENELLTRVGPGSPMGQLLRRYWYPIAAAEELSERWTKRVRLLGEDLVLFRDRGGQLGLIAEFCPHRRASLFYGIPQADGIRCPYHGWKFDGTGACLEQPNEPEGSSFKDKVTTAGYPVEELGGMIFAYLGPEPRPLLPRFDGFVEPGIRLVGQAMVPCNWLQIMENSMDPVHTEWLHGALYEFVREEAGAGEKVAISQHHEKIAFEEFRYGVYKRRLLTGQSEDSDDWRVGHPVVFPNVLVVGNYTDAYKIHAFQIRVPVDDAHTLHYWYNAYVPLQGQPVPSHLLAGCPLYDVPFRNEQGEFLTDMVDAQDIMAWVTQGSIADRSREVLGASDRGVTLFRKMLRRELQNVEDGRDPLGTVRDPEENRSIHLPMEKGKAHYADGFEKMAMRTRIRYAPIVRDLIDVFAPREPVAAGAR